MWNFLYYLCNFSVDLKLFENEKSTKMNILSLHASPSEALSWDPGTCISNKTLKFQNHSFSPNLGLLLHLEGKVLQATCSAAPKADADPSAERDVRGI